jgi:hypothetical protein
MFMPPPAPTPVVVIDEDEVDHSDSVDQDDGGGILSQTAVQTYGWRDGQSSAGQGDGRSLSMDLIVFPALSLGFFL